MQIKPLYKYKRPDGGITVSPTKPEGIEFSEEFRLIADEGKLLIKDREHTTPCIDVDITDGWYEIDDPEFEISEVNNLE